MSGWPAHSADGLVLGVLGAGLTLVAGAIGVRLVNRWFWRLRALDEGLTAEGRVLDVDREPGDQGREAITRTVVWFYAPDGREFRVEDGTGRSRVLGERVPLRYLPDRPEWAFVAGEEPGAGDTVVVLFFCVLVALAGVVCLTLGVEMIVPR
ncbi:DUF3592 domain-containing protein [Streptacidiphilus jiangxiensis]|uniref:DUF3592 domain-containing protein n=1 Tax=Streptacidiphilus jiangxiensis TaxID=235985 RepID=A0A1H7HKE5_STRJI|nr:DUF3592 domain-containing protein [Streptacidiphilus jiangxiensis]SEK50774.1 Protein of unknown function [Streptacidiphilus jiangxiensis]